MTMISGVIILRGFRGFYYHGNFRDRQQSKNINKFPNLPQVILHI